MRGGLCAPINFANFRARAFIQPDNWPPSKKKHELCSSALRLSRMLLVLPTFGGDACTIAVAERPCAMLPVNEQTAQMLTALRLLCNRRHAKACRYFQSCFLLISTDEKFIIRACQPLHSTRCAKTAGGATCSLVDSFDSAHSPSAHLNQRGDVTKSHIAALVDLNELSHPRQNIRLTYPPARPSYLPIHSFIKKSRV